MPYSTSGWKHHTYISSSSPAYFVTFSRQLSKSANPSSSPTSSSVTAIEICYTFFRILYPSLSPRNLLLFLLLLTPDSIHIHLDIKLISLTMCLLMVTWLISSHHQVTFHILLQSATHNLGLISLSLALTHPLPPSGTILKLNLFWLPPMHPPLSAPLQSSMLDHLAYFMDLATRFQRPAVRAYHARVLKALEQGTTTWHSDLTRLQTRLFLPSQEVSSVSDSSSSSPSSSNITICKDWNFSTCPSPCPSQRNSICFICKLSDQTAL